MNNNIIIIIHPDRSKSDQNQELVNWNSIKLDKNELANHNKSNEEICIDNHTEPKKQQQQQVNQNCNILKAYELG